MMVCVVCLFVCVHVYFNVVSNVNSARCGSGLSWAILETASEHLGTPWMYQASLGRFAGGLIVLLSFEQVSRERSYFWTTSFDLIYTRVIGDR